MILIKKEKDFVSKRGKRHHNKVVMWLVCYIPHAKVSKDLVIFEYSAWVIYYTFMVSVLKLDSFFFCPTSQKIKQVFERHMSVNKWRQNAHFMQAIPLPHMSVWTACVWRLFPSRPRLNRWEDYHRREHVFSTMSLDHCWTRMTRCRSSLQGDRWLPDHKTHTHSLKKV